MKQWIECSGIAEVAGRYDVFLLDQWGVLHDGQGAFRDAIDAVKFLHSQNKRLAIVSNSGKSAAINAARLEELGYERGWFERITTSGDLAVDAIVRGYHGSAIYWLDYAFDPRAAEMLASHQLVTSIEDAGLIYLSGWSASKMSWNHYAGELSACAQRGVPMICGNPDVIILENGRLAAGPGWVAEQYRCMGGTVRSLGKPDRNAFLTALGSSDGAAGPKAAVIGDSFWTDICGAANAGLDSILIRNGIHRDVFGEQDDHRAMQALSLQHSGGSVFPTYVLSALRIC